MLCRCLQQFHSIFPTHVSLHSGFHAKWLLRNERRNSILMTRLRLMISQATSLSHSYFSSLGLRPSYVTYHGLRRLLTRVLDQLCLKRNTRHLHFSQSKYLQIKKGQRLLKLNNDFLSEFRIFSFFLFSLSWVASACYAFVPPSHAPFFLATISSKYLLRWLYTLRHFHYIIKTKHSFELNKLMRRFFIGQ